MLLPFREHLDFGPTPYDILQADEGIPIVKGNVVHDVTTLELAHGSAWERLDAISIFPINNRPMLMFARFRPAAKPCRSVISSRK